MLRDAVPASEVFRAHLERGHVPGEWISACVAIVPKSQEPLHQFGATIVGLDIRTGTAPEAARRRSRDLTLSIGSARDRGFHAPLAGPLYFVNDAEIRRVSEEVRMLVQDLAPFTLSGLRIEDRYDTRGDIVLRCEDESGVAEALHGELVVAANRRAISSSYLAEHHGTPRAKGRADLMIRRYGTPEVLGQFELAFKLCADPPRNAKAREAIVRQLETAYQVARLSTALNHVDQVHLFVQRMDPPHWRLEQSFHLGPH
jgi:hypothetical protein